jgi:enoyl-CoA hydratase/carnithine racemase
LGIVAEVVAADGLLATARRWADEILQCAPDAIAAIKAVVQAMDGHSLHHSLKDMPHLPEVRRLIAGRDARDGPEAMSAHGAPDWSDPA